jgi:hypothetical protein
MWLDIKTKNHKIRIVYKNINWDWNYKWSRKDGLSDIPISAGSDFNVNVKKNNGAFPPFATDYLGNWLSNIIIGPKLLPTVNLQTPQIFSSYFTFVISYQLSIPDNQLLYYFKLQ